MRFLLLSVFAFIIGSIPTGLIIAKTRGVDLQKIGSGNIGATNVLRTTGKWPALLTLSGDILKGVIAVLAARYFHPGLFFEGFIGVAAVLGHNFSIFLKFRGGKGVATSIGVLCVYSPQTALITIIIWLMTVLISRYSSMGALVSFGVLPLNIFLFDAREKLPIALVLTIIMFIRHRDNISSLLKGTERKVGKRT